MAVDGPAGTGKSTVARRLAASLGAQYLDTGAMYRAAALGVLRAGIDPAESAAVVDEVARRHIEVGTEPASSIVLLVAQQRRIISKATTAAGGIVVEGRDIGTVVAPDAPLKVFLTATAPARAARRAAQHGIADVAAVRAAVERRDRYDARREASPMCPAEDAVELDTTALDVDAVLARLHDLAVARGLVVPAVRDPL